MTKSVRLFVNVDHLSKGAIITLNASQTHYLHNVMRLHEGRLLNIFNGQDGEWQKSIASLQKNSGVLKVIENVRPQQILPPIHLYFPPLKQEPLRFLIEKATELGVTHFHPLLTDHTVVRALNADKARFTVIEAAEQCERLDIPQIADLKSLKAVMSSLLSQDKFILYVCDERREVPSLLNKLEKHPTSFPFALLIGPEGGFSPDEFEYLEKLEFVQFVTLAPLVLRAETAAIAAVSQIVGSRTTLSKNLN